jgi:hypothetical protein
VGGTLTQAGGELRERWGGELLERGHVGRPEHGLLRVLAVMRVGLDHMILTFAFLGPIDHLLHETRTVRP